MKKLNLKQPKYIFPLVVFLPLTFLAYEVSNMFDGNSTASTKVATDSLNMELPDADNQAMKDKMASMGDRGMGEDGYSAIDGLGIDEQEKDSSGNGYSEGELNQIDKDNANRIAQQKHRKKWSAVLPNQESISTPIQAVDMVAATAEDQEEAVVAAAIGTNLMTMPRSLNTYRSAVRQHSVPLMQVVAATEAMETAMTLMAMMAIHMQEVMVETDAPTARL